MQIGLKGVLMVGYLEDGLKHASNLQYLLCIGTATLSGLRLDLKVSLINVAIPEVV